MQKFKVISLAISGNGKKVFRSGEEVSDSDFPKGTVASLVKAGHLEVIKTAKPQPKKSETASKKK